MGFSNPIIGGMAKLIRDAIRSPNYVAGTEGWQVSEDGTAEFNDCTIRGEFVVTDPDGSYVKLYDDPTGTKACIELAPAGGVPVDGYPATIASDLYGEYPNLDVSSPCSAEGIRSHIFLSGGSDAHPNNDQIRILSSHVDIGGNLSAGDEYNYGIRAIGDICMYDTATGGEEDWKLITLLNGWSNRVGGYAKFSFRRVASPPKSLQLVGNIIGGTYTGGTVIGTLPIGYRPQSTVSFACGGAVAVDATSTPTIQVTTTGDIRVWYMAPGRYCEFSVVVPLDVPS